MYTIGAEHDYGHIHKVIAYQDGGQQIFRTLQKAANLHVDRLVLLPNLVEVVRTQREEGHLGGGHKS